MIPVPPSTPAVFVSKKTPSKDELSAISEDSKHQMSQGESANKNNPDRRRLTGKYLPEKDTFRLGKYCQIATDKKRMLGKVKCDLVVYTIYISTITIWFLNFI